MHQPKTSSFFAARRRGDGQGTLSGTVRRLWPYLWPGDRADLKARAGLAVVLMVASKLVTVATPYALKWATDALAPAVSGAGAPAMGALSGALALTALYGLMRILMSLTQQGRDALFAAVAMNAVRRLANEVFVHLHQLSLRFHLERKTGGLTRVLERGRNAIETIVRTSMLIAAPTVVEFALISAAFLYSFDWRYVAAITVTVIVYLVYTTIATNWRIGIRRSMNESDTDANTKAIDSLLNFETVKYFGAEEREAARYDRAMARYERLSVKTYVSLAVLNAGQAIIFTIGMIVVLAMCVDGIRGHRNNIGDFVLLNAMMLQLYQPLNFMGMVYRDIKQAIVDIEMMFVILGERPDIADRPGARPLVVSHGAVRFENVDFAYDPNRRILRGVSFEAPAGRTVAIVGPSGAGKSTISRLLFRFYEPSSGRITIDGQDIAEVTQTSLRAAIGMVPQDTVLFNDTILYNIRYGRDDATEAEVKAVCEDAQIDAFIRSLPQGYGAMVGERGLKLSGGEKQRVAIARTMLKGPPILLLDEATSALDSFTEREIQAALERVSKGRTTIIIAHRLSTVVHADEILVLDKGVIAERGTHDELLALGGIYAGLWSRQREVDAAEEALRRAGAAETRRGGNGRSGARGRGGPQGLAARDFCSDWRQNTGLAVRFPMSVVDSIRRQLTPIHPQGYVFVAAFAAATLILVWIWAPLGWIALGRDAVVRLFLPRSRAGDAARAGAGRRPGRRRRLLRRPGDAAARARPRRQAAAAGVDLHVGVRLPREPRAGRGAGQARRLSPRRILERRSRQGERSQRAQRRGDRERRRPFGVVQIAGMVARRIVCFTQEGAHLAAGDRFGLIRFGSRVDVYLPDEARVIVGLRARAVAGETVIAEFGRGGPPRQHRLS